MAKTQNSFRLTEEIYLKMCKQILDGELKTGKPISALQLYLLMKKAIKLFTEHLEKTGKIK